MKKLTSMYKRYMFHPILYKTVTRTSIVAGSDAAVAALCQRWHVYHLGGPGLSVRRGAAHLGLGGLPAAGWSDHPPSAGGIQGDGKRQKKIHSTRSIIDYADEKIVSFEELEPEERTYCSLLSNLVLGLPLVAAALIASVL